MGLVEKIFGNQSEKEIKRITPLVDGVMALEDDMAALSDEELKAKTEEFKGRLADGETLDDILVEAFAVVREAAQRVLGMKHYRVQVIGGIILHQGRIAEMKTGEGKTLVSTLPAYLNALEGKGVHIVTVNDYLAKRDADWMGAVHRFLGLTVGVVLNDSSSEERRDAYNCDITYATNNELGFDYLRDNMVIYKERLVQRELNYAIVDEVDSVLIDEARTPLIISGMGHKSTELYTACDYLARTMVRGSSDGEISKMDAIMGEGFDNEDGDFYVNEKDKNILLTASGVEKAEKFLKIDNLTDPENAEKYHNVILALRAHNLMQLDKDYVVKDNEVLIVDEFTGRIMPGRRFSDGLHQAIEAKEGVKVKRESKTLATITFQNFFNKYTKKSGMTGTALTEEKEFRDIYGMDVVVIPTNLPIARQDLPDSIFMSKKDKLNAVVESIIETHKTKQPVLVGTVSIEGSEELSRMLTKRGIKHKVLNAKFHELEAEIVAEAGQMGAVTIATNMAGRGTDIKLGEGVKELGGLKIIGTERHEARRIDNQLRGRSGRQGDPGESKFYLSLEDDLMRLFGSERVLGIVEAMNLEDGQEIEYKGMTKMIEKAQKRIEGNNYGIRRNLLDFDQVNNEQREIIYKERRKVLDGENMHDEIVGMIKEIIDSSVDMCCSSDVESAEWNEVELNEALHDFPFGTIEFTEEELVDGQPERIKERLFNMAMDIYDNLETQVGLDENGENKMREIERVCLLRAIDEKWMDHIDDMDQLRQGIGLQSYGQRDPVVEYKFQGYDMFNEMSASIRHQTAVMVLNIKIEQKVEREEVAKVTGTNKDGEAMHEPVKRKEAKIGRNDPCPCGSGKKYKMCHGREA